MINSFGDAPKTIDIDDIKYKDYGKIPLKFIEGNPSDEMLIKYLKQFKTWMCSAKINPIYSIDLSRGDIFCCEKFFFSLVKGYDKLKKLQILNIIILNHVPITLLYISKNPI